MIDKQGYRANVAIVLLNDCDQVLWCKRVGKKNAWQFPQGGIHSGETYKQAMYRELGEEIGLTAAQVAIIGRTQNWLKYELPANLIRRQQQPVCIGQKQIWFLLRLLDDESVIKLDSSNSIEFDNYRWVDFNTACEQVIGFKQNVYRQAIAELKKLMN